MNETDVLVEKKGHIATITLAAPERLNSLTSETHRRLGETWDELAQDRSIRVVVFTGKGRAFCAGAEMSLLDGLSRPDVVLKMPAFTARQKRFFKPVIVAVNGICAGAGFHFINDSDIIIASERAEFVDTHTNVGQVAALEPVGLLRRIPLERVLRLVILGRYERLDAQTAKEIGLVSEVITHDELMNRAYELADVAARVSPATLQRSLEAIWDSLNYSRDEAYERGYQILQDHRRNHPDAREGSRAFIEKREPRWVQ